MKNAAKCDTSCELQNPVSHQNFERNLHFFGSMSVGVSVHPNCERTQNSLHSADRLELTLWMCFDECPFNGCWQMYSGLTRGYIGKWRYSCNIYSLDSSTWPVVHLVHPFGPPISQEYPLNLSILLGGGKETNQDSLSNGEWSGTCSDVKSLEMSSGEAR